MKDIIQEFLNDKKVAIVGASVKKDNFGRVPAFTKLSRLAPPEHGGE